LGIPDLDLIKQAQQGAGWARAVLRGCSGDLAGLPTMSRLLPQAIPMCSRSSVPTRRPVGSDASAAACSLCGLALSRGTLAQAAGFRFIEVPADAYSPVLKGAIWYPCPEPTVLTLTNEGGETL